MHCFKRLGERVMARRLERKAKQSSMFGWLRLTVSRSLGARSRCLCRCPLWNSCVLDWVYLGLNGLCATEPIATQTQK